MNDEGKNHSSAVLRLSFFYGVLAVVSIKRSSSQGLSCPGTTAPIRFFFYLYLCTFLCVQQKKPGFDGRADDSI